MGDTAPKLSWLKPEDYDFPLNLLKQNRIFKLRGCDVSTWSITFILDDLLSELSKVCLIPLGESLWFAWKKLKSMLIVLLWKAWHATFWLQHHAVAWHLFAGLLRTFGCLTLNSSLSRTYQGYFAAKLQFNTRQASSWEPWVWIWLVGRRSILAPLNTNLGSFFR